MTTTVLPPPGVVLGEETVPAQGLRCPMCHGDVRAQVVAPREIGLTVNLACATCGNWFAIMVVSWGEMFPEIAEGVTPDEDG